MNSFLYYLIVILSLFNCIFCKIYSQTLDEENYKDIKLLPSRDYFVLLNKGIYIYNINLTLKEIIYNFTDYETIVDNDYSISELNVDKKYDKYFISVLNKGIYLFIFEANSKKSHWGKYNLISYKYENSTIKYIIYFIKDVYDSSGSKYIINFFHFTVNLLENNQKTITKNAYTYRDTQIFENFKNSSLDDNYIYYSTIYENYIDCQYIISADNKEGLICFYFTRKCFNNVNDGFRKISGSFFNIENNFANISYAEFNITNYISYTNKIITVPSKNKNIFKRVFSRKFKF